MANSPYAGTVATLSGMCRAAVAATQPVSTAGSSFMATPVPRRSAAAARAASAVGSAVKSMLSPQALATIITVATLCGGLDTAGTVEVSGALGLDVIHYCDNDKILGSFVSTQNPRAQIHTCCWVYHHSPGSRPTFPNQGTLAFLSVTNSTVACILLLTTGPRLA